MPLTRNRIREIRSLSQKKIRDDTGLFVAEGLRLVSDAAASSFEIPEAFSTSEFDSSPAGENLLGRLRLRGVRCQQVSSREMGQIADTINAQGVLAIVRKRDPGDLLGVGAPPPLLVALDAISDPGNLGSIIRTCDWFGAGGILIGRRSVDLYNPKVIRATMGGIFHLPVVTDVDLPRFASGAREHGYRVFVADPSAEHFITDVKFPVLSLLAFGNEARGVSEDLAREADDRVAIRRYGSAESLNVGVACGILLAAHRRSSS